MNASQLKPAGQLAGRFGVKALVYGPPGTGKTPILNTAPRPVLLAVEPGLLSMRGSTIPTWEGYTTAAIMEFFAWFTTSAESKNYDTLGVDSVSQMAEIILKDKLLTNKDGRKAYGEMSRAVMEIMNGLYFFPQKHIYLIAKETHLELLGTNMRRPYFPGQDLNVKVPHLYDEILHLAPATVPGVGITTAFRTKGEFDVMARDRSGRLAQFEPPDLAALFTKCMT